MYALGNLGLVVDLYIHAWVLVVVLNMQWDQYGSVAISGHCLSLRLILCQAALGRSFSDL